MRETEGSHHLATARDSQGYPNLGETLFPHSHRLLFTLTASSGLPGQFRHHFA